MRWWVFGLIGLLVVGVAAAIAAPRLAGRLAPIRVGLLHSRTGPMKISEESMVEAEVLALEEINARGGLLGGRPVEWVIADGRSDPADLRPRGRAVDPRRSRRRDLRLLDLGQPQGRPSGRRAVPAPAVLPDGL